MAMTRTIVSSVSSSSRLDCPPLPIAGARPEAGPPALVSSRLAVGVVVAAVAVLVGAVFPVPVGGRGSAVIVVAVVVVPAIVVPVVAVLVLVDFIADQRTADRADAGADGRAAARVMVGIIADDRAQPRAGARADQCASPRVGRAADRPAHQG